MVPGCCLASKICPEVVIGEDDRVLALGRIQRGFTHIQQVGPDGQVRPVLLEDAERQQTRPAGALDGGAEIRGRKLFPPHAQLWRLRERT